MSTSAVQNSTGQNTTTQSATASSSTAIDQATRQKLLDLSTSDKEVIEIMQKKFGRDDLSFSQQQELQYLFSVRQQKVSLISNLLRSIFDTASNVVRNIRP